MRNPCNPKDRAIRSKQIEVDTRKFLERPAGEGQRRVAGGIKKTVVIQSRL